MINDPVVVAEITALHRRYEEALVSNDVATLQELFWDSSLALRFGVSENLYGAEQIGEFRKNRSPVDLRREVLNLRIVTFDSDCAIVTLEFLRYNQGLPRSGRQSQVWRKFDDGWKIVSAHVSFMAESYMHKAAAYIGLPIPPQYRDGVRLNLERSALIARPLLEFALNDDIESAAVFEA
jgi:ketosteroid isomerase-like protein